MTLPVKELSITEIEQINQVSLDNEQTPLNKILQLRSKRETAKDVHDAQRLYEPKEMTYICAECEKEVPPRWVGKWARGICPCYAMKMMQQRQSIVGAEHNLTQHREFCKRANLTGSLGDLRLDNFTGHAKKLQSIWKYTRNIIDAITLGGPLNLERRNLVLCSEDTGVGKTMLAAGIANELMLEAHKIDEQQTYGNATPLVVNRLTSIRWFSAPEIHSTRLAGKTTEQKDESAERFRKLINRQLIIIDDVGKDAVREEWRYQIYWEIMEQRTNLGLPTIITSNLTGMQIQGHIGQPAFDRLQSSGYYMHIKGASHRAGGMEPIVDDDDQDVRPKNVLHTKVRA